MRDVKVRTHVRHHDKFLMVARIVLIIRRQQLLEVLDGEIDGTGHAELLDRPRLVGADVR